MTRQPDPSADSTPAELAERHRRFRRALAQINSHQPAASVRALAADLWSRSHRS